jgi:hypothetical protein
MATVQDDGLDQIRRDLIDLVLREAGGRVAADPKSPVAQLLTGIVRREMAGAVEELRHGGAVIDSEALAEAIARRIDVAPRGDFRSTSTASSPGRMRDIILICIAAVVAVAIFLGGFALGGGLTKLQPAPAPSNALTDPALIPQATGDGLTPQTGTAPTAPPTGAAPSGMANQLQGRAQ